MRIAVGSKVSTEAWRFDGNHEKVEDRWSFRKFGRSFMDARVYGKVEGRGNAGYWNVKWEIDDSLYPMHTDYLQKEPDESSSIDFNMTPSTLDDNMSGKVLYSIGIPAPKFVAEIESETDEQSDEDEDLAQGDFDDIFVPKPKNKIVIFENELNDPDDDDINEEVMLPDLPCSDLENENYDICEPKKKNDFHEEMVEEGVQEELSDSPTEELLNNKNDNEMVEIYRNQIVIALGYIPKPDSPYYTNVNENEVCVVITSVSAGITDLVVGNSIPWNSRGVRKMKEEVVFKEKDLVRIFYNDKNIGKGLVQEVLKPGSSKLKLKVTEVFDQNILASELLMEHDNFKKGHIVTWDTNGVEHVKDLPLKKRKAPHLWKKNIEKTKKMKGEEYTNSKGVTKKKLVLTEFDEVQRCQGKCGKRCEFIDEKHQRVLRNRYWGIDGNEEKTLYLFQLIERENPAVTTTKSKSKRENTFKYHLHDDDITLQPVCQEMFLKTFGISAKRLRVVRSKKFSDLPYDVSCKHKNALNPPNNKLPQEVDDGIEQHIKSFPTVPSHYCRKESNKYYFEKGMSKRKMWKLYNSQEDVRKVSETKYLSVLSKYNIGFFKPKKDECSQCTIFKNCKKTEETKKNQEEHLLRANMAREEKERDKERAQKDDSFLAIICDLEQVSPCPKAAAQEFFM